MLIACALVVSALDSRARVVLDRTSLDFRLDDINQDIGRAALYLPPGEKFCVTCETGI